MINTIFPILIFLIITLLYLVVVYIQGENNGLTMIYYALILTTQLTFVYLTSKSLCGTPQLKSIFLWGFIPWIFIFLVINVIIKIAPGWKSPFSNTFGYGIISLMGIKDTMNNLLKSNFKSSNPGLNKIAEKMYQDQSLLVNEITPVNFELAIKRISPLLDSNKPGYSTHLDRLKHLVRLKDEVSRGIWYILSGLLTISVSNMGIASVKCIKTSKQIKDDVAKYKQQIAQEHTDKKQDTSKQYFIRD